MSQTDLWNIKYSTQHNVRAFSFILFPIMFWLFLWVSLFTAALWDVGIFFFYIFGRCSWSQFEIGCIFVHMHVWVFVMSIANHWASFNEHEQHKFVYIVHKNHACVTINHTESICNIALAKLIVLKRSKWLWCLYEQEIGMHIYLWKKQGCFRQFNRKKIYVRCQ